MTATCATSWSRTTCGSPSSWRGDSPTGASPRRPAPGRAGGPAQGRRTLRSAPRAELLVVFDADHQRRAEASLPRPRAAAVHVPRRVQELHLQLDRTMATLSQELGRPPTPPRSEPRVCSKKRSSKGWRPGACTGSRRSTAVRTTPAPATAAGSAPPTASSAGDRGPPRRRRAPVRATGPRATHRVPQVLRGADAVRDRRTRRYQPDARLEAALEESRGPCATTLQTPGPQTSGAPEVAASVPEDSFDDAVVEIAEP